MEGEDQWSGPGSVAASSSSRGHCERRSVSGPGLLRLLRRIDYLPHHDLGDFFVDTIVNSLFIFRSLFLRQLCSTDKNAGYCVVHNSIEF